MKPGRFKPTREQVLCIIVSAVFAMLSYVMSTGQSSLIEGNTIERGAPGTTEKEYELKVSGAAPEGGELDETIRFKVSPREYSKEEASQKMTMLMEELPIHMLGENESADAVKKDLVFSKKIRGYEGIKLSWMPDSPSLITYDGIVNNMNIQSSIHTAIRVTLKAGTYREEYVIPVTVLPADINDTAAYMEKLGMLISDENDADRAGEYLVLPQKLGRTSLTYSDTDKGGWINILLLGLIAAILLGMKPEQDRRQQLKKRDSELLMDYSELVSKLVIYMGAGLTAGNAWLKIADTYQEARRSGTSEERAVYEEMTRTAAELRQGVSEKKAFADFAGRCRNRCYTKLVSILEQNRRTGDSRSENALLMEAQEAFEQRKNTARRLGEEAGTKLMLPLMISLITVMVIVAVPAMMTLF